MRRGTRSVAGWLFVAPATLHLMTFVLAPIAFALYLSLHRWDVLKANKPFVGMANYAHILHDPLFRNALVNSLTYTAGSVPLGVALALGVAVLVSRNLKGMPIFRALYYMPAISSAVALSMVWTFIYLPEHGLLDWLLVHLGFRSAADIDWLQNRAWAMPALIFMSLWTGLGPRMILFVAGLTGIPEPLYEAASLDGATPFRQFWSITLPLLIPTTLFVLVTSTIGALQVFTPVYMMTRGGPVRSTDVVGYHIYNLAWRQFHMGLASAESYLLFLLILVITALQFRMVSRRMEEYSLT
jgi:multiple sugar transport system permease protein